MIISARLSRSIAKVERNRQAIIELYVLSGWTVRELGAHFQVGDILIREALKAAGVTLRGQRIAKAEPPSRLTRMQSIAISHADRVDREALNEFNTDHLRAVYAANRGMGFPFGDEARARALRASRRAA